MSSGLVRLAPSIVCICVLAFVAPASRAAESPFASASEAFGRGDYRGAVALFEAARAGADGPSVPYNIAVCRYKLGEFATAEAEFADLGRRFPAMRAIAEYNRGLALLGLERPDDARAAFATARAEGDPKIVALADERLQELGPPPTAEPNRRWEGLFELAAGDDDNVALVDDLTLPAGQAAASPFTELLGYAARSFAGRLPATLDFSGYSVRYSDASQFDQDSLRASASFEREHDQWRFDFGPHYGRSTLGGDGFQSELGAGVRISRPLAAAGWRFVANLLYTDIGAVEARFAYLEGAKRQARVALVRRTGAKRFDATLDFEDSDRAEASVSARRQRLVVGYRSDVTRDWSVGGAVSYRLSRYDRPAGPNERLTEIGLNAQRALGRDWSFAADYRYSSNDADLAGFSYDANRIAVSIGKIF